MHAMYFLLGFALLAIGFYAFNLAFRAPSSRERGLIMVLIVFATTTGSKALDMFRGPLSLWSEVVLLLMAVGTLINAVIYLRANEAAERD